MASKLDEAPDHAIAVVYATLDECIAASSKTLGKMQTRMDTIADTAMTVALALIAKAAAG
jgi:hypothetical protein